MTAVDGLLDTSVVVRYLTADHPRLSRRAAKIIEGDLELGITANCIAEIGFVLERRYGIVRDEVVEAINGILTRANVTTVDLDEAVAMAAVQMCKPSHRVSFADVIIWASARSLGIDAIYTFDERFPDRDVELRSDLPK